MAFDSVREGVPFDVVSFVNFLSRCWAWAVPHADWGCNNEVDPDDGLGLCPQHRVEILGRTA